MIAQTVRNINACPPGGGVRALPPGVRLVINRQKRGRKASTPSQTEPHVEHVAMDSESEGAYVRVVMETLPTLARISLPKRQAAGPKRGRSQGHTIKSCMVSTRKETRRKAHVPSTSSGQA